MNPNETPLGVLAFLALFAAAVAVAHYGPTAVRRLIHRLAGPNYWTEFEAPEEERDRLGESHPEVIRRHGPSVLDLDKALAWDPNGPSEQP